MIQYLSQVWLIRNLLYEKKLFIFAVLIFCVSSYAQTGALKFQSTNFDFGLFDTSISGKNGNCSFQFKNIGTESVTIDKVVLTSGDIRVDYPKTPIMPNEEGNWFTHMGTYFNWGRVVGQNSNTNWFVELIYHRLVNGLDDSTI